MGAATAHAGILAATKAIWEDLEEHGILDVLLDPEQREDMHATSDAGLYYQNPNPDLAP